MTRAVFGGVLVMLLTGVCVGGEATVDAQPQPGPEFRVNQRTSGFQWGGIVTVTGDGSFTVFWSLEEEELPLGTPTHPPHLLGQRFGPSGNRIGNEFTLREWGGPGASVAMDAAGDFVVVWGGFYSLWAQRFGPDGSALTNAVGVAFSYDRFFLNDVATAPTGDFVMVWLDYGTRLYASRFDEDANWKGDTPLIRDLPAYAASAPAVAMDADRDFVVVWAEGPWNSSPNVVLGRRFTGTGASVGPEIRVSTDGAAPKTEVDIACTQSGSFVVVWRSDGQDGDGGGIFGQRFNSDGRRLGPEFQVNAEEAGDQLDPSLSVNARGDFAVVWTSHGQDGSDDGVFLQLFDAAGRRVGGEPQVNVESRGRQARPAVAVARDGGVVAVWEGPPGAGDPDGIFARRFGVAPSTPMPTSTVMGFRTGPSTTAPPCPNGDQADAQSDGLGDACVAPDVGDTCRWICSLGAHPIIGQGTVIEAGVTIGGDDVNFFFFFFFFFFLFIFAIGSPFFVFHCGRRLATRRPGVGGRRHADRGQGLDRQPGDDRRSGDRQQRHRDPRGRRLDRPAGRPVRGRPDRRGGDRRDGGPYRVGRFAIVGPALWFPPARPCHRERSSNSEQSGIEEVSMRAALMVEGNFFSPPPPPPPPPLFFFFFFFILTRDRRQSRVADMSTCPPVASMNQRTSCS